MAKNVKKLTTLIIVLVIGIPLLFFFGSALILFLAPGVEIFGVRYVNAGSSDYHNTQNIKDFTGDIYIETYGAPITITLNEYYNTQVSFAQEFIGFTSGKLDKANLSVSIDEEDNLHIKTKELKKFIYAESMSSDYYLKLVMPFFAAGRSIFINSEKSEVTINGTINANVFELETSNSLKINGALNVKDFKFHTSKVINIDKKISATNLDVKSTNANINITKNILGDIRAETNGGDIRFMSCENLTAITKSGSIRAYGESLNSVRKKVTIKTSSGSATLGNVSVGDTSQVLEFTSSSGSINVTKMYDGKIKTERGKVNIKQARILNIDAKVGDIDVGMVSSSINIQGRNGRVKLGELGVIANPTVRTTSGTIRVSNASGNVDIKSRNNNVVFANNNSYNIKLYAGKTLTATGLKGVVDAYANGDVEFKFDSLSGDVNVEVGSKCNNVEIDASCISYANVNYFLKSSKGKKAKLYAGDQLIEKNSTIQSSSNPAFDKIVVKGSYAVIKLKLGV